MEKAWFSCLLLILLVRKAQCFAPLLSQSTHRPTATKRRARAWTPRPLGAKAAGSFFNPVPEDGGGEKKDGGGDDSASPDKKEQDFDDNVIDLLRRRKAPSKASQPSTINGIPTSEINSGFQINSKRSSRKKRTKPAIEIGPGGITSSAGRAGRPLNDVTKPEYDDQGYTLYSDEETGEKSRVFEALVDYPCEFTMKIVGANEGAFVEEMVGVVAESCNVPADDIQHSVRALGKWTSVTVQAPVDSAEMLYQLYENVDRDPRVKFKF